jgi:hypothetical protein
VCEQADGESTGTCGARAIFTRLADRLAMVGAGLDDVVELVSYHIDMATEVVRA